MNLSNDGIRSLNLFTEEEHRPFCWQGGSPAVLLVHGFLGSPAEMRPLAHDLHRAGWTVEGLLLPGFGPQIGDLFEQQHQDWIEATHTALVKLSAKHHPVLLAGYSMGGTIALNVAANNPPDGLILLAPFYRLGNRMHHLIWQFVRLVLPTFRPFRRADFADPRMVALFDGLPTDIDLANPETIDVLRQLRVPSRFVDQLIKVSNLAKQSAAHIDVPTLIIQGLEDEAVRPAATRQLLQKFPGPVSYEELQVGHDLVQNQHPLYSRLVKSVLSFAHMLHSEEKSRVLSS